MTESLVGGVPWMEKYRPTSLDEIIDHKIKIDTLRALIREKELPHLLFYGQSGTGKTSLVHCIAREIFGDNYKKHILELNASNDRGIETVRTQIPNFLKISSKELKIVILDEADAMTNEAQNALKRTIEIYSGVARFVIIANNISKIIAGLRSRCMETKFVYLSPTQIIGRLNEIVRIEHINITQDALERIIEINRDFRQILNVMQGIHNFNTAGDLITVDYVDTYLEVPTRADILNIVAILDQKTGGDFRDASNQINDLYLANKWDLHDILKYLLRYVIDSPDISDNIKIKLVILISDIENKVVNQSDCLIQLQALLAGWMKSTFLY